VVHESEQGWSGFLTYVPFSLARLSGSGYHVDEAQSVSKEVKGNGLLVPSEAEAKAGRLVAELRGLLSFLGFCVACC